VLYGESDAKYVEVLQTSAADLEAHGLFDNAEPLLAKAAEASASDPQLYVPSLQRLACVCMRMGSASRAETLHRKSLDVVASTAGQNSSQYASALLKLSTCFKETGTAASLKKSLPLCLQACEIRKRIFGHKSAEYTEALLSLGMTYVGIASYDSGNSYYHCKKAEPFLKEACEITSATLDHSSSAHIEALKSLAILYEKMRSYSKAEQLFLQIKTSIAQEHGSHDTRYALALKDLTQLYTTMTAADKLEEPLYEMMVIKAATYQQHPGEYVEAINDLVDFYLDAKQTDEAESYIVQAQQIQREVLGQKHPSTARTLNLQAKWYGLIGNSERAEQLTTRAAAIAGTGFRSSIDMKSKNMFILSAVDA
jgi:tetratricopeptide (TPR) repeat protein